MEALKPDTFIIADTHFGHKNIISYENRPFADVDEMDVEMIRNWNDVVCKTDKIFVLGDFSFHPNEITKEICQKLNGSKTLIMGNHDCRSTSRYLECGFKEVYKHPIIMNDFWILSHYPMYVNANMPYANIFGHVHGNPAFRDYTKQTFCASVERIGYTPIKFSEIQRRMAFSDEAAVEFSKEDINNYRHD